MRKALRAVAALFLLALTASCSKPEDPIQVDTTAITILNQTSSDWKGVLIVVNDHYRGAAPVLKSEGRINAPIGQFETGFDSGGRRARGSPRSSSPQSRRPVRT